MPSSVMAAFSVTRGVRCRMYLAKGSFSIFASSSKMPDATEIPALRKRSKPFPATSGLGSCMQATTRRTPAAIIASAQGPGASLVGAGFKTEVENSAAGFFPGLLQGQNFGVFDVRKPV